MDYEQLRKRAETIDKQTILALIDVAEKARKLFDYHGRLAALVEQWAEGLRSGKRYTVTTATGEKWTAGVYKYAPFPACYQVAGPGFVPNNLMDSDPARAAAYMLAVSEDWVEVAND